MSGESSTGYNAAADLIGRNLDAGRGAKTAFIDNRGRYSYAELAERVNRFANLVRRRGIQPEQRILLCLHDTIDFPTAFLGAIKAGAVPVAVNTQLAASDFAFMAADSRARTVVVSAPLLPVIEAALATLPEPRPALMVSGGGEHAGALARRFAGRCVQKIRLRKFDANSKNGILLASFYIKKNLHTSLLLAVTHGSWVKGAMGHGSFRVTHFLLWLLLIC